MKNLNGMTEIMLDLAFRVREAELWKVLSDMDLFGVRLPDGQTTWCCVMGQAGEHLGVAAYVGDRGVQSFYTTLAMNYSPSQQDYFEGVVSLDCINCDFENGSDLVLADKEEAAAFARARGLKLKRSRPYPEFIRHMDGFVPWNVTDPADEQALCVALEACLEVAAVYRQGGEEALRQKGFVLADGYPKGRAGDPMPVLIPEEDGFRWTMQPFPARPDQAFPHPSFDNVLALSSLKKLPRRGTWHARYVHVDAPVQEKLDDRPYFPAILAVMDNESGMLLPTVSPRAGTEPVALFLQDLVRGIEAMGAAPSLILVADQRTEALLADFCTKAGIKLSRSGDLDELDEAMEFLQQMLGAFPG